MRLLLGILLLPSALAGPGSFQFIQDIAGSYVSAIHFNKADGSFAITGSTFGTVFDDANTQRGSPVVNSYRCFVAVMKESNFEITWASSYGHNVAASLASSVDSPQDVSQACSDIMVHDNHLYLAGHSGSAAGGAISDVYNANTLDPILRYGTIMDIAPSSIVGTYKLAGGFALEEALAVYPVSMDAAAGDNVIFMASMTSDQSTKNNVNPTLDPNLYLPVGDRDALVVEAYEIITPDTSTGLLPKTFKKKFREFYDPGNGGTVHVAGIVKVSDNALIVAGHTKGQGKGFGKSFHSSNLQADSPTLDGFVTKFSTSAGIPILEENNAIASSYRVESMDGGDEEIWGICAHGYGQNPDTDHVYVVGATTGNVLRGGVQESTGSKQAFIMKIQVSSMEAVWEKQLAANPVGPSEATVEGVSCVVDGDAVYWAGHVTNGIVAGAQDPRFYGKTDVFVGKLSVENGAQTFLHQVGSSNQDSVARRGGLTLDLEGNVIMTGNTHGSMYERHPDHDEPEEEHVPNLFVMTVSKDGTIDVPIGHPDHPDYIPVPTAPVTPPVSPPVQSPVAAPVAPPVAAPVAPPVAAPVAPPVKPPTTQSTPNASITTSKDDGTNTLAVVLLIIALVAAVLIIAFYVYRNQHNQEAHTDRTKVLRYLNNFDVEDVDLKHSATGGWHCSYANDLAHGKYQPKTPSPRNVSSPTKSPGYDPMTERLTSQSTTPTSGNNSLFLSGEDEPRYGVGYHDEIDDYHVPESTGIGKSVV